MVQDAVGDVVIQALATPPHGYIYAIRQLDALTGIWYSIFPEGQQGKCTKGAVLWIDFGLQNTGETAGTIYCIITRLDTGAELFNGAYNLLPGAQQEISGMVTFTMPNSDVTLRFEVGHL